MPEASENLRSQMRQRFGSIDTLGPEKYLRDRGYELTPDWQWKKENVTSLDDMTREEFDCLLFLAHEWDYGSLIK